MWACAGVIIHQVMACAIVQTRLVLAIINIGLALFSSVSKLTGAHEVINEVRAYKIVLTGIWLAVINF